MHEDRWVKRFRAWFSGLPGWGLWLYYAVAFGALSYLFATGRSVSAAVFGGVAFATLMTLFTLWQRRRRAATG